MGWGLGFSRACAPAHHVEGRQSVSHALTSVASAGQRVLQRAPKRATAWRCAWQAQCDAARCAPAGAVGLHVT